MFGIEISQLHERKVSANIDLLNNIQPDMISFVCKKSIQETTGVRDMYVSRLNYAPKVLTHFSGKLHTLEDIQCIQSDFLIVSGDPRGDMDTLEILRNISHIPDIWIVVNPSYICNSDGEEKERFLQKLSYANISGVITQISFNNQGYEMIDAMLEDYPHVHKMFGCPVLNNSTISKFRYRPWKGVHLDDGILNHIGYEYMEFYRFLVEKGWSPFFEGFDLEDDGSMDFLLKHL